jgi:hypothetical protein
MTKPNKKTQRIQTRTPLKRPQSRGGRRLSDLFPDLANYAANDLQTTRDLLLTESEFGSKYRKGKSHRLQELETKNIRVAYENLRIEHARISSLGSELDAILNETNGNLHHLLTVPKTPEQATALLRLWFINSGPRGSRVQVTLEDLQEAVKKLKIDDVDTEIARRLIFPIGEPEPVQKFAARVKLARQSIYPRIRRLTENLERLSQDKVFAPLVEAVIEAKRPSQTGIRFPVQHPLMSISLLPAEGPLGHVSDLIRIAVLCAANQESVLPRDARRALRLQVVDEGGNQTLMID